MLETQLIRLRRNDSLSFFLLIVLRWLFSSTSEVKCPVSVTRANYEGSLNMVPQLSADLPSPVPMADVDLSCFSINTKV